MPLTVAVFLAFGGLLIGVSFLPHNGFIEGRGGFAGAAAIVPSAQGAEISDNAALNVQDASFFATAGAQDGGQQAVASYAESEGMVRDIGPAASVPEERSAVMSYIVQKGDSLASVASYFGISQQTILAVNTNVQTNGMRAGEVITILPTSGVLYESEIGDTITSIANSFNVSENAILRYNPTVNFSSLAAGTSIVIPSDSAARSALAAGIIL